MSLRGSGDALFFADTPPLGQLCSMVVSMPESMAKGSGSQAQIIKCREILFTEPQVIGTPLLGQERKFQIIMQQSFYKHGKLQTRFSKTGMEAEKPKRVTPSDFQACFRYTLLAKLAPLWNKAGDFLIQGRDFVTNDQKMTATRLTINVSDKSMCFAINPCFVRMPPIKLVDLEVPRPMVMRFLSDRPHGRIEEYSIQNNWCSILPSMKKGKIVNVCHEVPQDGPLSSYKDMKKYWKNTYGYRLPDTDEGMVYYQVYFKLIGNMLFTYPECCIRPRDILRLPSTNVKAVHDVFLQDLKTKFPEVCGHPLNVKSNAAYHVAKLNSVEEIARDCSNDNVNLSSRPATGYCRPSYGAEAPLMANTISTWTPSASRDNVQNSVTPSYNTNGSSVPQGNYCEMEYRAMMQASHEAKSVSRSETQNVARHEMKNVDSAYHLQGNVSELNSGDTHQIGSDKFKPIFKVKPQKSVCKSSTNSTSTSSVKRIPMFKGTHTKKEATKTDSDPFAFIYKTTVPPTQPENQISQTERVPATIPKPIFKSQTSKPTFAKKTVAFSSKIPHSPAQPTNEGSRQSLTSSVDGTPQKSLAKSSTGGKRKHEGSNVDGAKKARSKPKVQEGIDVASLAQNNQLGKANTATLVGWLKEKGISCRSKDKKPDLIQKVYTVLNITQSEA